MKNVILDMIKSITWIVVLVAVAYWVMGLMGYEINKQYFTYSKNQCQSKLASCTDNLVHQGIDNAKCNFNCVDPALIIKKK
jgi:hypothetical protein